jgi:hypothetical protein
LCLNDLFGGVAEDSCAAAGVAIGVNECCIFDAVVPRPVDRKGRGGFLDLEWFGPPEIGARASGRFSSREMVDSEHGLRSEGARSPGYRRPQAIAAFFLILREPQPSVRHVNKLGVRLFILYCRCQLDTLHRMLAELIYHGFIVPASK